MRLLLGIDLGTTGLKAVVFDLEGKPLAKGFAPNQYLAAPPGWAEQDPRMWWAGCCQAIRSAFMESGASPADVVGIGVCGFHHCPVFLRDDGEPARPSIVTHDSRLGNSLADLQRSGIWGEVVSLSGSRVMIGHFPPIYHFVLRNEPKALEQTRWILLSKDYIRYKLTGRIGTDLCDATGTNLIAMPEQEWSDALCALLQVPREKLPPIGHSSQVFGSVTVEAAQATGLQAGTPVVYGGGDSHCALVGLGLVGSGEVGLLLGTNSTLRASFGGFVKHVEHSVWAQQHVVPGKYTVSASSMAGSSVLSWFKELCVEESSSQDQAAIFQELESAAANSPPGCNGLFFHPYLYGERSPFYNPEARGAFVGITHWHQRGHFVRSIMEGVAFCIANCFDAIQAIAYGRGEGVRIIRIGESGGTRLSLWRQIIADALEFPLEVAGVVEAGCWGAALLAGVGVGEYRDVPSAVSQTVRVVSRIVPASENSALYRERRALFNATYRALEPILYQGTRSEEVR
jgi:xylulokinase